jgi:hypothetical protein
MPARIAGAFSALRALYVLAPAFACERTSLEVFT